MTQTAIESLESRSIQTSGGRGSGQRVFHISGYTNVSDIYNVLGTTVGTTLLPRKGDSHPDFAGLIAKDFSLTPVQGHNDLFKLTWSYEVISRGFPDFPSQAIPQQLPNEVTYVELGAEIRAEFVLAWRGDAGTPAGGDPVAGQDIGGTPIDAAGNPTSLQRNIQEITVTETVNVPNLGAYRFARFTRNSTAFFGSPAGTMLYRGASVRRTGVDVYQVSHSFVEDEYYHLQQQPLIAAPDMTPVLLNGVAKTVFYIQPFPNKSDFNALSPNF